MAVYGIFLKKGKLNSGKLKHHLEIQAPLDTRDEYGSVSYQTWISFCYAWGSIEPLSGREYFAAAQAQSEVSHKITIRYRANIMPYYRITWKNRTFNIQSIINTREENRELIIYCTEAI